MRIDEALDYEAQMQASCMMTEDFERAYRAFIEKKEPIFEGN
jgi:enoyl-CoA hydratase/carnithine racemase